MRDKIVDNLSARFDAYTELVANIDADMLPVQLDIPKHKSLQEHLWCVVGARESYSKALVVGQWEGFECSLTNFSHKDFLSGLRQSADSVLEAIAAVDDWTDQREDLLLTLAEHEVMHEGQIIRHVYGVGGTLPTSWKWA